MNRLFQNKDLFLYIPFFILGIFLFFSDTTVKKGKIAVINYKEKIIKVNLYKDQEIKLGKTLVEIKDGRIRIKENICPAKICVKTGFISKSSSFIICVPEKLIIKIPQEDSLDALSW